ncbi:MAG TPA: ParB/RepB/Spo0J family partition protein [Actinomycetota bacterium]
MTKQRGGLGRGLSALIPGATEDTGLLEIPVGAIAPNTRQPREAFEEEALTSLARSIREVGVLQPVVVRLREGGYELVAGERRLRAAKMAGLATIPAIVRETDDTESLREALIENLHREDLNALEQAAAFQELLDELGVSHDTLGERLGYSRSHITNTIRLLQLPATVQRMLVEGRLSSGHARALLGLDDTEAQEALALRVLAEDLSVRDVEALVAAYRDGDTSAPARRAPREPDPRAAEVEELLSDALATRVRLQLGRRKGKLIVEFGSEDDLARIVEMIVVAARRSGTEPPPQ